MKPSRFIPLGRIIQEWGIRGQVKFLSFNPQSSVYPQLSQIYSEESGLVPLEIEEVKRHGNYWLFKFKSYEHPETARELRGKVLGLPREELPRAPQGEVYLSDLEGLEVRSVDGRRVGKVLGFMQIGEGEVMRIGRDEGEVLVPYQKEFVSSTSLEDGMITLTKFSEELLG